MKRYLVTGGAGFIGSHIAETLAKRKQFVRVLDNFSNGKIGNLENVKDRIEIIRADIWKFRKILPAGFWKKGILL